MNSPVTTTAPAVPALTPPAIRYKNGNSERMDFRELDVFERHTFVNLLCAGNTPELVMLCLDRDRNWMRQLDPACYLELSKYFINANFHWALEIALHDPIMGLKVGPLMAEMGRVLGLLGSRTSANTRIGDSPAGSEPPTTPAPAASAIPTSNAA